MRRAQKTRSGVSGPNLQPMVRYHPPNPTQLTLDLEPQTWSTKARRPRRHKLEELTQKVTVGQKCHFKVPIQTYVCSLKVMISTEDVFGAFKHLNADES